MDVCHMELEAECFDVVLDKGTLDAVFAEEAQAPHASAYLHEMNRVLRTGTNGGK